VVYSLLGLVGSILAFSGPTALAIVLASGAILSMAWYLRPNPDWLPSPRKQVARHPAVYVAGKGGLIFGGLLGVGVLTKVTTPLVWVGAAASLAAGSALWGLAYGAGFGLGRSVQLFIEYLLPESDPAARLHRAMVTQGRLYRALGLLVGLATLVRALTLA
jgi:hypothetical protein